MYSSFEIRRLMVHWAALDLVELWTCSIEMGYRVGSTIDNSRLPYFSRVLRVDADRVRNCERWSLILPCRATIPCAVSFASLRRTVVTEPSFRRNSCFGVITPFCSCAYPISIMTSKSSIEVMKGICSLSNSRFFLSAANNCGNFIFSESDCSRPCWR